MESRTLFLSTDSSAFVSELVADEEGDEPWVRQRHGGGGALVALHPWSGDHAVPVGDHQLVGVLGEVLQTKLVKWAVGFNIGVLAGAAVVVVS